MKKTAILNEVEIHYTDNTIFAVQVGKGPKGSYKTRITIKGDLSKAFTSFLNFPLTKNWKKRLVMPLRKNNSVLLIEK